MAELKTRNSAAKEKRQGSRSRLVRERSRQGELSKKHGPMHGVASREKQQTQQMSEEAYTPSGILAVYV